MYHALVFWQGSWISYGVHAPCNTWSDFIYRLRKAFGEDNATYVFWEPTQELHLVSDAERLINRDVADANRAQRILNAGYLKSRNDRGDPFSLAYHIDQLRKEKTA